MKPLIGILTLALFLTACGPVPPTPASRPATDAPTPTASQTPAPVTPEPGPTPGGTDPARVESATMLPDPAGFAWQFVTVGLTQPVDIQSAGDGSGRLFLVEQPGRIRILRDGQLLGQPFLDITDRVGSRGSEQGLLGLAFHPRYAENGYFFVNYTDRRGDTVIARFRVSSDPHRADPASEVRLLQVAQPYANHNGGGLAFGPDGYLYIGLGDGGSAGDPKDNGQNPNALLGKLLRLDVDRGNPYAIPADNPFAAGGGAPEVWALGLRNPWRFAFDLRTGDLYIGDVGQNAWEEIDFLPAGAPGGANFGWRYREGAHPYKGQPPAGLTLVEPVAEYPHDGACSVTGGVVYRGGELPEFHGVYLYGDFCRGQVWGLLQTDAGWQSALLFQTGFNISTFGQDERGEVYLANYGQGAVYRLARK